MTEDLILVSHHLCPYVQRAAIALAEKQVPFTRMPVDLADKPDWFKAISSLGKVPLLRVVSARRDEPEMVLFESAPILEYLEETQPHPLHPSDPSARARHRAWIEFGSSILNDIAAFYSARDEESFQAKIVTLRGKFARLETELGVGPWFAGRRFSLVDAVFGPIFRYFDTFDAIDEFGILRDRPNIVRWRGALASRPSIQNAADPDYPERLQRFLRKKDSQLSRRLAARTQQPA